MRKTLFNLCLTALLSIVSTTAWALSQVNGVYQIGSAADFNAFAALVNGGNTTACAELTTDINLGSSVTMIGTSDANGSRYEGTFDGKGHTISFSLTTTAQYSALFRYVGWCGIIQNLKVQGTVSTNSKFAGGLVAFNKGIIRDCYIDVTIDSTVSGDATHGGIVANGNSGTIIENCLAKIKILGSGTTNCGGVVGWASSSVNIVNCLVVSDGSTLNTSNGYSRNLGRNEGNVKVVDLSTYSANIYDNRPGGACYNNYVTNQWETSTHNLATTVVSTSNLADGKICYQLNNDQSRIAWVQRIGTDPFPVPAPFGTGRVYASGATGCNGQSASALTYSNSGSDYATKHSFDKFGICSGCGCFNFHYFELDDPTKFDQTDRAVLLKNVTDIDMAEGMNRICNGFKLNMKMANDISYTAETGRYIFNASDWINGNFNGDGHTLTIEMVDVGNLAAFMPEHCGVFENVIMHGSISTNGTNVGSISGEARQSAVRNVYCDIDITSSINGDNTSGGLFGKMIYGKTVENVVYAGTFTTPRTDLTTGFVRIGGFAGWSNDAVTFRNCAFLGRLVGAGCANDTQTAGTENSYNISRNPSKITCVNVYVANPITSKYVKDDELSKFSTTTATEISSGGLCYKLNGEQSGLDRFYQTIGTDACPLPFATSKRVYKKSASEYINFDVTGGKVQIGNGAELRDFSAVVNAGGTNLNAELTADIDMDGVAWAPIGNATYQYTGTFDGAGKAITNFSYTSTGDYNGLFGYINGATVKDFSISGDLTSTHTENGVIGWTNGAAVVRGIHSSLNITVDCATHTGGVVGGSQALNESTLLVENCTYDGTLTSNNNADSQGGIIGYTYVGTVRNCLFNGTINGNVASKNYGGILGYARVETFGGIHNCLSIGKIVTASPANAAAIIGNWNGPATSRVTNNYYLLADGSTTSIAIGNLASYISEAPVLTTTAKLTSGEACYQLNGSTQGGTDWYQTLGTDTYPVPFSTHDKVYSFGSSYINGVANINNATDLVNFTATVNSGGTDLKGVLTTDIDMTGITDYYPIGDDGKLYVGEFDGQGHVVKNLVINNGEYEYQGLFGRIGNGADIKNLVLDNTCSIRAKAFAGVIGGTNGSGDIYVTNVGNEGTVSTVNQNAAGIVGVDMNGAMNLHITNCYVTGAVNGGRESATICGWSNLSSTIQNCYSIASLTGKYGDEDSFTRGSAVCVNCYEIEGVGTQNNKPGANRTNIITAAEVASGALCYKLNENSVYEPNWFQTIGSDDNPVLSNTHGVVNNISAAGYTTQFVHSTDVAIPAGIEAFAGRINGEYLTLVPIADAISKDDAVILRGSEGYYSFVPTTGVSKVTNSLIGSDGNATGGDGIYALSKQSEIVGFYPVGSGVTIPAGKAYLNTSAGVKAFTFFFDDDATSINEELRMKNEESGAAIYNLAGQRTSKMQKGINIINGKKILK